MEWRNLGVIDGSGEPCTLLRLQIPCAPLRRCRSMESFRVKAARQSTGSIVVIRARSRRSETGPFDRHAPFKMNYNTPRGPSPPRGALKISKYRRASSITASSRAAGLLEEHSTSKSKRGAWGISILSDLSQITARICLYRRELDLLTEREATMRTFEPHSSDLDCVVVGGGLAGLSAAALVAQAGRSVILFEQAGEVGGRAATQVRHGISFNLGPHALYFLGDAFQLLRELEVPFTGRVPSPGKSRLLTQEGAHPLPRGLVSLVGSRLFSLRDKGRLIRFLATLPRLDGHAFDGVSLSEWVLKTSGSGNGARFLRALFRVSTYVDDAERLSAGVAIEQLKLALHGNVWYIDGGWQTLANGVRARAVEAGAMVRTGARVTSVRGGGDGVIIGLRDGEVVRSRTAVVAVAPSTACDLLGIAADAPLAIWTARSVRIKAACLDVALDWLERPRQRFALGLDQPFYYSVHSAAARLATEGTSVLHVMKYLRHESGSPAESTEQELEGCLDRLQPGWRSHTIARRYLPNMTVSHCLPLARDNGLAGRPAVSAAGQPNAFLAGDWVGSEGMLADASAASARSSARQVLAILGQTRPEREHVHVTS